VPGTRIEDKDRGYKALVERLYGMAKEKPVVRVGLLAKDGDRPYVRKADQASNDNGADEAITILQVGIFNEFGTDRIPERSFIRAWFDEHQAEIRDKFTVLMKSVVRGDRTKEQILDIIGLWCVGSIQQRISAGIGPENAESTVKAKGKGSSTPLVDTGSLRSSISYEIGGGG
jgi:hypothetical protein